MKMFAKFYEMTWHTICYIKLHMSNLAISNPFQYLEQNLNVNLLKGISTTLIESDFFSLLPLYWFGNHSANKYTEASKSTLIEREENDEWNIWIQLSDADVIEINSDLSCSTSKLNQELKEELKSAISYDNLEQQGKFIFEFHSIWWILIYLYRKCTKQKEERWLWYNFRGE